VRLKAYFAASTILFVLPLMTGCGSNSGSSTPTIYVAGKEYDATKSQFVACYWKNGATAVELNDGTEEGWGTAIAVQ